MSVFDDKAIIKNAPGTLAEFLFHEKYEFELDTTVKFLLDGEIPKNDFEKRVVDSMIKAVGKMWKELELGEPEFEFRKDDFHITNRITKILGSDAAAYFAGKGIFFPRLKDRNKIFLLATHEFSHFLSVIEFYLDLDKKGDRKAKRREKERALSFFHRQGFLIRDEKAIFKNLNKLTEKEVAGKLNSMRKFNLMNEAMTEILAFSLRKEASNYLKLGRKNRKNFLVSVYPYAGSVLILKNLIELINKEEQRKDSIKDAARCFLTGKPDLFEKIVFILRKNNGEEREEREHEDGQVDAKKDKTKERLERLASMETPVRKKGESKIDYLIRILEENRSVANELNLQKAAGEIEEIISKVRMKNVLPKNIFFEINDPEGILTI